MLSERSLCTLGTSRDDRVRFDGCTIYRVVRELVRKMFPFEPAFHSLSLNQLSVDVRALFIPGSFALFYLKQRLEFSIYNINAP